MLCLIKPFLNSFASLKKSFSTEMNKLKTVLLIFLTIKLSTSFSFHCYYGYDALKKYLCINYDLNVKNNIEVEGVTGLHVDNERNSEVDGLVFFSREMRRIPKNLLKTFPKLKEIIFSCHSIYESKCLDEEALKKGVFAGGKNVVTIGLQGHQIIQLKSATFDEVKELESLSLDSCKISNVDKNAFEGLKILKWLSLKNNKIENFTEGTFDFMGKLEVLELQGNELKSISRETFKKLNELKKINLKQNKLKLVDFRFTERLNNLESLNLIDNYCINDIYSKNARNLNLLSNDIISCSIDETSGLAPWNLNSIEKMRIDEEHLENRFAFLNSSIGKSCNYAQLRKYGKELENQIMKLLPFKNTHLEIVDESVSRREIMEKKINDEAVKLKKKYLQLVQRKRKLKQFYETLNEVADDLISFVADSFYQ